MSGCVLLQFHAETRQRRERTTNDCKGSSRAAGAPLEQSVAQAQQGTATPGCRRVLTVPAITGRSHPESATEPERQTSCSPKRSRLYDGARSEMPGAIVDALENPDLPERKIRANDQKGFAMARRVFFSFHYSDIMNANIVRNSGQFKPSADTGFYDKSLWEEAATKGAAALQKLIDNGLHNTSVTCFLIGEHTHARRWCKYELEKSLADRKGILGILLPNQTIHGPKWISKHGAVHIWNHAKFANWVEEAATAAGR